MERRTTEGPMDWEYQSKPPMDESSPFTKLAQKSTMFTNPLLKPRSTNPNPFAFDNNTPKLSPVKPQDQPRPPFSPLFSPQLSNKPTGPAFRNPAFMTPQRRVDFDSGPESSPAMTDASPMPVDTPDADGDADISRLTLTPSPTKSSPSKSLFEKTMLRNHASGRGDILIRANRDKVRKRKRLPSDKDVGSARSRVAHGSDESDSDYEEPGSGKTKKNKQKRGWFSNFLAVISDHPNAPAILSKWLQLFVNMILLGIALFGIFAVLRQVRADMWNASEKARQALVNEMSLCAENYRKNGCSPRHNRPPALEASCNQWETCMNQDPSAVMQIQVSARNIAEIMNEFVGVLTFKTWAFLISLFLGAVIASNLGFSSLRSATIPEPVKPAVPVHSPAAMPVPPMLGQPPLPNPQQAYIWAPLAQTPRHVRKAYFPNDVTDSEASPDFKAIMPPQTPSLRRSPSKGDRNRSPSKGQRGRSPSKEY